ncbi:MAG TPA: hypothetical protein VLO07_07765 [Thermoanaerobaculia bacterium]|nr:hypothetical protein [Thermoanaerobaculia bacterium]
MRRAALAATLFFLCAPLWAGQEEVFEKAFSMEGVSRISVQNVNGRIEAFAWEKPYLKVRAVKTASGSSAEDTLAQTEIRIRKLGEEIRIETINPSRHRLFSFLDFGSHHVRVDYEIQVPAGADIRLETCNGAVHTNGIGGSLSCDAVNGSIEIGEADGPVRASTVNGSLRIGFHNALKKSHLETVNGSVEVAFNRASSIRYDLETVNGRIEGDIDLAVEGRHGPKEARGSYNGGAETLHCETVNGSIRLKTN